MRKLLSAALLALTPAAAWAQAPADADPAMWVVRDDDTTIYLFGTFHLLDSRPWFNDEVKTAFDASDELVLEARLPDNPTDLQPLIQRYALYPEGQSLSQHLSEEQKTALREALSGLGVPAAAFDRFEPWFISMTLAALAGQRIGIEAANGPETILTQAANARGMPIGELEGMEFQVRMLDSMPAEQQLAQLDASLEEMEELDETLPAMLADWSEGDVEALVAMLNDTLEQSPDLYRTLFTDRNAAWADWIKARLDRPGTVFVAVGAGHLAGDDSVQAQLAERGVTTTRVPHEEEAAEAASR